MYDRQTIDEIAQQVVNEINDENEDDDDHAKKSESDRHDQLASSRLNGC